MADKMSAGALAGKRSIRLRVPLLFAMAVIVPPQLYYEVVEKLGYADSYFAFWGRYLAADGSFCTPFHIVHQTIIIVVGHHLASLRLPVWAEAPILIAATALGCWLAFEIARRVPPLRPLFGLALRDKPRPLEPALAAP